MGDGIGEAELKQLFASIDKDHNNMPSEQRIKKALWLFKRDVLTPYEDDQTADNQSLKEEVNKFMEEQVKKGLSEAEARDLQIEAIVKLDEEGTVDGGEKSVRPPLAIAGQRVISHRENG